MGIPPGRVLFTSLSRFSESGRLSDGAGRMGRGELVEGAALELGRLFAFDIAALRT